MAGRCTNPFPRSDLATPCGVKALRNGAPSGIESAMFTVVDDQDFLHPYDLQRPDRRRSSSSGCTSIVEDLMNNQRGQTR